MVLKPKSSRWNFREFQIWINVKNLKNLILKSQFGSRLWSQFEDIWVIINPVHIQQWSLFCFPSHWYRPAGVISLIATLGGHCMAWFNKLAYACDPQEILSLKAFGARSFFANLGIWVGIPWAQTVYSHIVNDHSHLFILEYRTKHGWYVTFRELLVHAELECSFAVLVTTSQSEPCH